MIPTSIGILQQKQAPVGLIQTDVTELYAAYIRYAYSGYCAINVTPDTIATTITKIDTGDGVIFATVTPTSGTGDYSFRVRTASNNNTGSAKSMTLRITDNAGIALPVDITFIQYPEAIY